MFQKYIDETSGGVLVTRPYGFIAYDTHVEDDEIYIADIFVMPHYRGKGHGKDLEAIAIAEARRLGVNHLSCSVNREDKNWRENYKIYTEHCGYVLKGAADSGIINMRKNLGGQPNGK